MNSVLFSLNFAFKGLEQSTEKSGRAFISDTYLTPRKVLKNRYIRTDTDPAGNAIPIFENYYENDFNLPKDWTSCHQIANYRWIFEIVKGIKGFVDEK